MTYNWNIRCLTVLEQETQKQLEKELNIKIFERSGSGVFLTDDGMEFVRYKTQGGQLIPW